MSDDFRINTSSPHRPNASLRHGPSPLRDFLRYAGPAVVIVGLGFMVIGIGDFFTAFGTFQPPRYFWCAFVGMPLLAVGGWMCQFAYLGPMARYVAEETAPVNKDVINYLARGTQPALRAVASAIKEGFSDSAETPRKTCPNCGERNEAETRFCTQCGSEMAATATCTHCGASNDPSANFCAQCGHAFAAA